MADLGKGEVRYLVVPQTEKNIPCWYQAALMMLERVRTHFFINRLFIIIIFPSCDLTGSPPIRGTHYEFG